MKSDDRQELNESKLSPRPEMSSRKNFNNNYFNNESEQNDTTNVFIKTEDMELCDSGDYLLNSFENFEQQKRFVSENDYTQISIQKQDDNSNFNEHAEVVLFNGNWDTARNIVAEMHNVKLEHISSHQNSMIQHQMNGADIGAAYWSHPSVGDGAGASSEDPLRLGASTTPSPPHGSDSGLGGDSPEGNLSWLLNFRLDDIPGLTEFSSQTSQTDASSRRSSDNHYKVYIAETIPKQYFDQHQVQNVNVARIIHEQHQNLNQQHNHQVMGREDGKLATPPRYSSNRKPPFTYTELIEHALREKGELTVSGIYQWISDHFSFYKANDDRWKNSVRHNLSINPHFRKGSKAVHGAGHLWTIAQKDDIRNTSSWNAKKQRMQQFMQTTANDWQRERQQEMELAAATASIMPEADNYNTNTIIQEIAKPKTLIHQTAQEILGGIKREVEVEYIIPVNNTMDFMCPISKEQVAEECGLNSEEIESIGNDYLITELNPNALGLNLTEAEIITTDQLFSDDLNFQCYELSTEQ